MNSGNYVLVGAGGTGSIAAPHILRHLRKIHTGRGAFHLYIVDGDTVSEKNTSRQDFGPDDIGCKKADVLAARLDPSGQQVTAFADFIDDSTIDDLIRDGDTVLITVDNYRARADIERHALTLPNITVINAGNEATTASCQIFVRRHGQNLTPPLSYNHPEILSPGLTRREEGCMVHVDSPDNEQTIAANLMSASWLLAALVHVETQEQTNLMVGLLDPDGDTGLSAPFWHELHADLHKGKAGGPDWRTMGGDEWRTYQPLPISATVEIAA